MSDDSYNVDGLEKLLKALKTSKVPKARVGILGEKNARSGKANSNATIGAAHEYGTNTLPQRSFLRMPIQTRLNKAMQNAGALNKDTLNQVIKSGSVVPWLTKVAIIAQGLVLDAFATSGFGTWKLSDMSKKKNHQTLIESQQLRNSITYEVKE